MPLDGELRHHLRDSLLMRQPRWVKKVYQQIQEKSNELSHKLGRPPEVAELAKALNINEDGTVALLAGQTLLGWTLTWIVVALAAVNLFLGFCVGCFMYYQLARVGVRVALPTWPR